MTFVYQQCNDLQNRCTVLSSLFRSRTYHLEFGAIRLLLF